MFTRSEDLHPYHLASLPATPCLDLCHEVSGDPSAPVLRLHVQLRHPAPLRRHDFKFVLGRCFVHAPDDEADDGAVHLSDEPPPTIGYHAKPLRSDPSRAVTRLSPQPPQRIQIYERALELIEQSFDRRQVVLAIRPNHQLVWLR